MSIKSDILDAAVLALLGAEADNGVDTVVATIGSNWTREPDAESGPQWNLDGTLNRNILDFTPDDYAWGPLADVSAAGTVALWFRADSVASVKNLFSHRNGSTNSRLYLDIPTAGNLRAALGTASYQPMAAISVNTLYHAAMVWDGLDVELWLDGVLVDSGTVSDVSGGWLGIGILGAFAQTNPPTSRLNPYDGEIGDLVVCNRPLIEAELQWLAAGNSLLPSTGRRPRIGNLSGDVIGLGGRGPHIG